MTNAIHKIWQELEEVSTSLSSAKDKLTAKLEEVATKIDENEKDPRIFKDHMFNAHKEVARSKENIAQVQRLVQGLQMRIVEVQDIAGASTQHKPLQRNQTP
jgi:peptidoglycan hydrolase CwlO-like protein